MAATMDNIPFEQIQKLFYRNDNFTYRPEAFKPPQFSHPTHTGWDYAEMGFLFFAALIGCPLNLLALMRMVKLYTRDTAARHFDAHTAYLLLKIHLNLASLLVLITHCPGKLSWLVTYRWTVGSSVCKLMHFLWFFAFNLCSNVVVCIALERFRHVMQMSAVVMGTKPKASIVINAPEGINAVKVRQTVLYKYSTIQL